MSMPNEKRERVRVQAELERLEEALIEVISNTTEANPGGIHKFTELLYADRKGQTIFDHICRQPASTRAEMVQTLVQFARWGFGTLYGRYWDRIDNPRSDENIFDLPEGDWEVNE